jgi:hypothetical protein
MLHLYKSEGYQEPGEDGRTGFKIINPREIKRLS